MAGMRENIKTLFSRSDLFRFGVLAATMLGGTVLELASLGAVPLFVSILSGGGADRLSLLANRFGIDVSSLGAIWSGVLLGGLFLIRTLYLVACYWLQERVMRNRHLAIASRLFRSYMNAPYEFHIGRNVSVAITKVNIEVDRAVYIFLDAFLNVIRCSVIILSIVVLLVWYDPFICFGSFLGLAVFGGCFMVLMRRRIGVWGWHAHLCREAVVKDLSEGLGSFKDARILGRGDYFCGRLHRHHEDLNRNLMCFSLFQRSLWPLMELITIVVLLSSMVAMLVFRGYDLAGVAPAMALLGVSLARMKGTLTELMIHWGTVRNNAGVMETICEDLRILEPWLNRWPDHTAKPMAFEREIDLEAVSFRYASSESMNLTDVSLKIPHGSSLGLVGPTGSGKTTLLNMLLGLLEPTTGRILVDGVDIRGNESSWQRQIGYVPQDVYLLDDTLRANIAFGVDADSVDESALREALTASCLDELVSSLPEGLDTVLGERGIKLSGGQRQRVAIARALYVRPQVLVLDEATSALDMTTEREVVEAIERLRGEHTMIIVAHRFASIRGCDKIAYLEGGRVVDIGSYDELFGRLPSFRQMATSGRNQAIDKEPLKN
ncbi:MAG: ABC transporter ATP-binding protein [Lentisphaerae bacterium]|nr:ABC transporter ATP-binding protein [Lentisphaerota bacterium]